MAFLIGTRAVQQYGIPNKRQENWFSLAFLYENGHVLHLPVQQQYTESRICYFPANLSLSFLNPRSLVL